ncbi:MAG TPA: hypothetical protein PL183_10925, partial [Aquamicrobium sp.]|nr:hypothetical protein [Aquamicrobium sp.]
GPPRDSYNTDCQPVTNPRLRALIETRKVGGVTIATSGGAMAPVAASAFAPTPESAIPLPFPRPRD